MEVARLATEIWIKSATNDNKKNFKRQSLESPTMNHLTTSWLVINKIKTKGNSAWRWAGQSLNYFHTDAKESATQK